MIVDRLITCIFPLYNRYKGTPPSKSAVEASAAWEQDGPFRTVKQHVVRYEGESRSAYRCRLLAAVRAKSKGKANIEKEGR